MYKKNVTQKDQLVIPGELGRNYGIAILPVDRDPLGSGRGMLQLTKPVAEIVREIRKEERRGRKRKSAGKESHAY